jgi:hypothetical protein
MTKLTVINFPTQISDMEGLLCAAPHLITIHLGDRVWVRFLSLVAQHCTKLQQFRLARWWPQFFPEKRLTFSEVQDACQWPLPPAPFPVLEIIDLTMSWLSLDALHFLYSQLSFLPKLREVHSRTHDAQYILIACPTVDDLIPRAFLLSKFPHVVPDAATLAKFGHADDFVFSALAVDDTGDGALDHSPRSQYSKDDLLSRVTDFATRFRTMFDTPAVDGRKRFFDRVYAQLTDDQRLMLQRWDYCKYTYNRTNSATS